LPFRLTKPSLFVHSATAVTRVGAFHSTSHGSAVYLRSTICVSCLKQSLKPAKYQGGYHEFQKEAANADKGEP
jgi:hypothetical protein